MTALEMLKTPSWNAHDFFFPNSVLPLILVLLVPSNS